MRRVRHWAVAALAASALTAATVTGATTATAAGAPETDGVQVDGARAAGARFTPAKLPLEDAVLSSGAQLDARTTWAAGFRISGAGQARQFTPVVAERVGRDGAWRELPSPTDDFVGRASAVAGSSPSDAWLVGDRDRRNGRILAQHWDGTAWTSTTVEAPPGEVSSLYLLGASAPRPGRAWAVGGAAIVTGRTPGPVPGSESVEQRTTGLIERWDGTAWHRLATPEIDGSWWLSSVTEIAPDDVWAVGNTAYPDDRPVLLHYDGRDWTRVTAPAFTGLYGEYQSVAANGPDDVWVVGRAVLTDKDRGHPLVAHYDGRSWSTVAAPEGVAGKLWSVTAVPGGMAAVGWDTSGGPDRPLGLRLTHGRWETLDLSVPGYADLSYQAVVAGPGGRLTAVGAGTTPKSSTYQPMLLTDRG
ncbi:hypothetical protein [Kitasatospora purpeofusca]|uniref:Secreted protein n=1 Tax=Kitasatospora purpeofusca TaxID=67352 RepID=A0ABZ1TUZ5_9ACTN|nr:hypothetical protein [Kitasatospora purpeofusca]